MHGTRPTALRSIFTRVAGSSDNAAGQSGGESWLSLLPADVRAGIEATGTSRGEPMRILLIMPDAHMHKLRLGPFVRSMREAPLTLDHAGWRLCRMILTSR